MSLEAISEYVFPADSSDGRMKTITWLQGLRLLANQIICNQCTINMEMIRRERPGTQDDKWAWRCSRCKSVRSIRGGSFFEGELAI